ncbi:MAG: PD-(D/E)XK nuclease family protein [Actinomycetota bacterium]|nr:PD-(D/E)XK nuclease family protein [Actinomycetota bacterium]
MLRFPDIAPGQPIAVSATLYVIFRSCPQQALGRLRGVYPADSIASFKGSLAHRVFARHLMFGPIPEQDVLQACREEIGAPEGHLNMKLAPLDLNRPSKLNPVLAEVGDLYARFKRLPTAGFQAAEVNIEVDVGGGAILRGRVDAIFDDPAGAPLIIDWKTGAWLEDSEPQLEFYALLWTLERGELPSRVEAVSVQTGERTGIEPTLERAAATSLEIASMIETLRVASHSGDDIERRAGPHCRWCPLLEGCSEGTAAVEILGSP